MNKSMILITIMAIICILFLSAVYMIGQNTAVDFGLSRSDNSSINSSGETPEKLNVTQKPDAIVDSNNNDNLGTINFQIKYGQKKYITDASVKLYAYSEENSNDLKLVDTAGNPLMNCNAELDSWGPVYQFREVPYGQYKIVSERNGSSWIAYHTLDPSTDGAINGVGADDPDLKVPDSINHNRNTIYGWVRDSSSMDYLPDLEITLLRQDTINETRYLPADVPNNPTISKSDPYTGFYYFNDISPGIYKVQVKNVGYVKNSIPIKIDGSEQEGTLCNIGI
ncbi:hypothetical protein [Methanocella arvoryzae]|uniref:Carboxypeptidase regulatory-like domain-containing protein n=1 Tax=Methanocella arvoryzae (strain DSM 22066 / NBRC 105507 / MRE50) TaxID=351160 RepID=Q0W4K8_METAR|nr:hypothetical protein [Methanocella arvoryzae]CAJ36685.1 hypothetical protein RCIX1417 [Methanocella arvoryzae MRE50]